jgi:hypothetical protein
MYNIRFLPNKEPSQAVLKDGDINIYQYVSQTDGAKKFRKWLVEEFSPRFSESDVLVQDGAKLRDDIRKHLATSTNSTSFELLTALRDCFVLWVSIFWYLEEDQKVKRTPDLENNAEIREWNPGLFVRSGNVEMHVLKNFLMEDLTVETFFELENSPPLPKPLGTRDNWLDDNDINLNVRKLMANAGWYPDEEFNLDSLVDWNNKYTKAITRADGIFRTPGCDFYEMFFELSKLRESGNGFNYLNFPGYKEFYKMLRGHNVLFVTPFAREIQALYDSGDIFKIWLDFELPSFSLTLIEAPMSIYPNRPAKDWTTSFDQISEKIHESFSENLHTLFFASSGCYGLPLCDMVYQSYGIASVYYGNWTNFLFGIRQNTTESVDPTKRNLTLWQSSSLNKIEGLAAVDAGRYILDDPGLPSEP